MDNTAIAYDFTFYGSGQQNHFTLAEEDLVEVANFQIWNNRLGLLDNLETIATITPLLKSTYEFFYNLEQGEEVYYDRTAQGDEYDDFEDFDEAYEQASSLLDTIIKSLPKAVLCEIIGSLEYASSYSWEKVNADDYRLDDPDVWYRNIVI